MSLELLVFVLHHLGPGLVPTAPLEDRSAIGGPIFHVQEMSELVQHEVLAVVVAERRRPNRIPGDDGHAVFPGLAEPDLLAFQYDPAPDGLDRLGNVGGGVNQDRRQAGKDVGVPVEQEDAGLGGDRHLDLVGQLEAAAAFEVLLGEEDLDEALELPAIGFREIGVERHILLDDLEPCRRAGRRSHPISALVPPAKRSQTHSPP